MNVFEVAIGLDVTAGGFRADVLRSPDGGLASAVVKLDVEALLGRRKELERGVLLSGMSARGLYPEERKVREAGRPLFYALLGTGEVGRYRAATAVAAERGEELRVVLRISEPALAALPWEAMFDDGVGGYVCRQEQLVRHVGVLARVPPLTVNPPLRVLGIVSSPQDLKPLDVAREQERLTDTMRRVVERGGAEARSTDPFGILPVLVFYWRLPGATGLPSCSWVAARLSLALYLAAAGPSAKARSTLVVTWATNAGVAPPMPCGWSP